MLQIKTFNDTPELNIFLKTMSDDNIVKIEWKINDDSIDDYSEYFMVVYKIP